MSHQNTTFAQILQFISRHDFNKIVKQYKGNFHSKGFSCWDQFSAMLFAQLSGQKGLRGIEAGLETNKNRLYHLGIAPVKRSTLSYANNNRDSKIYEELFYSLLGTLHGKRKKHGFRFKNPLYSVDASTIDLCLNLFPWANFREKKGGVKLHVKLDHSGYIPSVVTMTDAKCHEVNQISKMKLEKGDAVVFDRGYTNFKNFAKYCEEGIYFVTRLKNNAAFEVLEEYDIDKFKHINSDLDIKMSGYYISRDCPYVLRVVESYDPETDKTIRLLTNQLTWSPKTVSGIYKDRWQIEVFFKTIKQNLKIKSFFGTSENAVRTQIWICMIAFLILKYMANEGTAEWTVQTLMAIISTLLFIRKDIWLWLNKPKPKLNFTDQNTGQLGLSL